MHLGGFPVHPRALGVAPVSKIEQLRDVLASGGDLDALLSSWADDVRRIAFEAARRVGVYRRHEIDEVEALAWEEVAKMVAEERSGVARPTYRFDAHLVMRLRNSVKLWLDSEAGHAPAARMSSLLRRRRAILSLIESDLTPSEAVEILTMAGHRDGVYSVADLTVELVAGDVDEEGLQVPARLDLGEMTELMMGPEDEHTMAPFEGRDFVDRVVDDVAYLDIVAALLVRVWLESVWAGGEAVTAASLADWVGLPDEEVEAALALGRRLAAYRLERMGVHAGAVRFLQPEEAS